MLADPEALRTNDAGMLMRVLEAIEHPEFVGLDADRATA
jgi:hypothetical protein